MVENSDFAECYKCNCKINPIEGNNEKINIISFSCNHQLCYKCFIHLLIERQFSFISSEIFSKNNFKIYCKCEQKGFMNISLDDLIELLKVYNNIKIPIQVCSKHKLKYGHFCENCNLNLCDLCFISHKEKNNKHNIKNQYIFDNHKNICKIHNKNYFIYCKKCNNLFCEECLKEINKCNHDYYIDFEKFEKHMNLIKNNLKFKDYTNFSNFLSQREKYITNIYNDEIFFVKGRVEQLTEYLNQMCSKYVSILYDNIYKIGLLFRIINLLYFQFYKDLEQSNFSFDSNTNYLSQINYEFTDFKFNFYSSESLLNSIDEIIKNLESNQKIDFTIITNSLDNKETLNQSIIKNKNPKKLNDRLNIECELTLKGHSWSVLSLIQLNNGKLVSSSSDQTIKFWDFNFNKSEITTKNHLNLNNFFLRKSIKAHSDSVNNLLQLKNGNLISCSKDKTIKIWDISNLNDIKELYTLKGHHNSVNKIIELQDKSQIISCSFDGKIIFWDLNMKNDKIIIKGHTKYIYDIILINKNEFASSSFEEIKIWNIEKKEKEYELKGHNGWIYCLTLLKENYLVSGSYDRTIIIWNLKDKIQEQKLIGHTQAIQSLISYNKNEIISASWDKSIKIWKEFLINDNDKNLKYINYKNLIGHSNEVLCLCDIGNGWIASGSDDSLIKIWDLNEYEIIEQN